MKILGFLLITVTYCEGANILALLATPSPSHHIFNTALVRALAQRGHQITVLSPDTAEIPNVTYLKIEGLYENIKEEINYQDFLGENPISMTFTMFDWKIIHNLCEIDLKSSAGQTLLKSTEKFDLIITEAAFTDCLYGLIPKFGSPPVVAISAYGIPPWMIDVIGTPENPSYIPNSILPYSEHMTLSERMYNTLITGLSVFLYKYYLIPKVEKLMTELLKTEQPSYLDIVKNFSIFLSNVDLGFDVARPVGPNVIPVGGMHIKAKPDPLPKDIQDFLDGAKDGFFFFSLGSNLQSSQLPKEKLKSLLEAFAEIPQRVLWKFETDNIPGLPSNVKIGKWLPQSDILAHPNIKAFISHCGKLSTTESVYRGVPVIGVPFFADQWLNLQQMMGKGVAVKLDFLTLTKESVLKSIREILNNQSYHQNMKKLSTILKDHPQSALDRAVFWTEHVIRHGGAPHLRPASTDLYWYQYLLLDVLCVFASGVLLIVFVLYFILRTLLKLFRKNPKKSKQN
ncbi:UDP-glucuronosyltransferase 2B18 [Blattella germanica]|nr:UDP-glucuronosyltransferase 2B18 [Blattella germanica]